MRVKTLNQPRASVMNLSDAALSRFVLRGMLFGLLLLAACGGPSPSEDEAASVDTVKSEVPNDASSVGPSEPVVEEPLVIQPLPEGEAEDGGYTIAQVMQLGHESKLYRELYREDPPVELVEQFQTLYGDLAKRTPPMGETADWQERATALKASVDAIAAGDPGGVGKLKRYINCSSCHGRHRG
ncbi:MAG: hypothetical protein AAGD07_03445 [Planctomycetota bacterium]